ncbi:MAG: hypothetical protein ACRDD3_09595, partial [Azovibrio sp.]
CLIQAIFITARSSHAAIPKMAKNPKNGAFEVFVPVKILLPSSITEPIANPTYITSAGAQAAQTRIEITILLIRVDFNISMNKLYYIEVSLIGKGLLTPFTCQSRTRFNNWMVNKIISPEIPLPHDRLSRPHMSPLTLR